MALCQFRNVSGRMVILRCVGPEAFFQEKVIFPFEEWQRKVAHPDAVAAVVDIDHLKGGIGSGAQTHQSAGLEGHGLWPRGGMPPCKSNHHQK
jgi:hypothetical protein